MIADLLPGNKQDKASVQGGSMNRGSPLLGGTGGSARPTWQGSPHKQTQPAGSNSESLSAVTYDCLYCIVLKLDMKWC